jgi:hypothetical protein
VAFLAPLRVDVGWQRGPQIIAYIVASDGAGRRERPGSGGLTSCGDSVPCVRESGMRGGLVGPGGSNRHRGTLDQLISSFCFSNFKIFTIVNFFVLLFKFQNLNDC